MRSAMLFLLLVVAGCGPTGPARLFSVKWEKGDTYLSFMTMEQHAVAVGGPERQKLQTQASMEIAIEGKVVDVDKEGVATIRCRFTKFIMAVDTPAGREKFDLISDFERFAKEASPAQVKALSGVLKGPFEMRVDRFLSVKEVGGQFWRRFCGTGLWGRSALPPRAMRVGEEFTQKLDIDMSEVGGFAAGKMHAALVYLLREATDTSARWSISLEDFSMDIGMEEMMKMEADITDFSGDMWWDAKKRTLKHKQRVQMELIMTIRSPGSRGKVKEEKVESTITQTIEGVMQITPAK